MYFTSYSYVSGMQKGGQSKGGREFQRPVAHVKMLPVNLSLHDPVMWETWDKTPEELREEGQNAYYQSKSKPLGFTVRFCFRSIESMFIVQCVLVGLRL